MNTRFCCLYFFSFSFGVFKSFDVGRFCSDVDFKRPRCMAAGPDGGASDPSSANLLSSSGDPVLGAVRWACVGRAGGALAATARAVPLGCPSRGATPASKPGSLSRAGGGRPRPLLWPARPARHTLTAVVCSRHLPAGQARASQAATGEDTAFVIFAAPWVLCLSGGRQKSGAILEKFLYYSLKFKEKTVGISTGL